MSNYFLDTDEGRRKLQRALIDNGYMPEFDPVTGNSNVDGILDRNTSQAMINARIANKLTHQDKAFFDPDLERALGLLTIQQPEVKSLITSGLPLLIKLILGKGITPMDLPNIAGIFNNASVLGLLRNILLSIGTSGLITGLFTSAQWEQIVGVLVMIVSAVLSWIANRNAQSAKAIAKAVLDHPDLTVVKVADNQAVVQVSK